jgi:nucleoside transporter
MMRARLGSMMFLEYFIWGAWYVTLGTWLVTTLHFSGQQVGWATGAPAIGAIVAPLFVGGIADRTFATQKVMAALHFIGALLLMTASLQTSFTPFCWSIFLYSICYMPTLAMTSALALRHSSVPRQEFGIIRVFGSVGWISAGLIVGCLRLEASAIPMRMAAFGSVVMAIYCLTLPDTPPIAGATRVGRRRVLPEEWLRLLRGQSLATFLVTLLGICIPLQIYYGFTNLFLNESGVLNAAGKMTAGQISETVCMITIPWFLRRLGTKYMLAVGLLAWVIRYALFAYGAADAITWALWGGIILHGICFDFFFVVGQIYVDAEVPAHLRGAAQGLITFITYGVGMLLGAWLSGLMLGAYAKSDSGVVVHDWQSIWIAAAVCAAAVLVFFLISFNEPRQALGIEKCEQDGGLC